MARERPKRVAVELLNPGKFGEAAPLLSLRGKPGQDRCGKGAGSRRSKRFWRSVSDRFLCGVLDLPGKTSAMLGSPPSRPSRPDKPPPGRRVGGGVGPSGEARL